MGYAPSLMWLIVCCLFACGPIALIAVALVRRRAVRVGLSASLVLPDFAIVDCGAEIHFVPVTEVGHVLSAGRCPCQPRRTANRRRLGRGVVYVDHRCRQRRRP